MDRALALYLPAVYVVENLVHFSNWLRICVWVGVVCVQLSAQGPAWSYSPLQGAHAPFSEPQEAAQPVYAGRTDFPSLPGLPGGVTPPLPPGLEAESSNGEAGLHPAAEGVVEGVGKYSGMLKIPAGPFQMGSPPGSGRPDEHPFHRVFLKEFYIAKYETTVEQYCRFLNEAGLDAKDGLPRVNLNCAHCPIRKKDKSFRPVKGMANVPMVCVSWNGAAEYARWAGGRLPTAAEWEKAAKLTTAHHPGDYLTVITRQAADPVIIAWPGIRGMTGMVGNVWEWTSDWYSDDFYGQSPSSNPAGPPLGLEKEIRGGSWAAAVSSTRGTNRHRAPPQGYFRTVGFRIVKD